MGTALRVLLLEDRPEDAELIVHELRRGGFDPDWQRVDNEADFRAGLKREPHIILADYSLPQWDAPHALGALRELGLDIPFIMISGTIGEDLAVACIKQGAADYLLKDRLSRLGSAVTRALEEQRARLEKRRAQENLQRLKEFNEAIVQTASEGIALRDAQGCYILLNPAAVAILGGEHDDLIGKHWSTLIAPEHHARVHEALERQKRGEAVRYDADIVRPDRVRRTLRISASPRFEAGEFAGTLAIFSDITEQRQAQDALAHERNLLRTLIDSLPDYVYTKDTESRFILGNVALARQLGEPSPEHILGKTDSVYFPAERAAEYRADELRIMSTGEALIDKEEPITYPDGRSGWLLTTKVPLRDAQGNIIGLVGNGRDITERKQAELEIRRLNAELEQRILERTTELNHIKERVEAILNSSNDIIIMCQPNGVVEQANPALSAACQIEPEDIFRAPLTALVAPSDAQAVENAIQAVVGSLTAERLEVSVVRRDGTRFEADMLLSPVIERGERLLGVVCSLRDISERKVMEAQLRQMLKQAMDMSEMRARYVSMAAHDLGNPLAAIQALVSTVQTYGDRMTEAQKQAKFNDILSGVKAMADILNDVLTIGRVEGGQLKFAPAPLDLRAFCQDMIAEVLQAIGSERRIRFSHAGPCDKAHADAKLLRHIVGNLLSNALKYSPVESEVVFTLDCTPHEATIRIQDQGIGIPEADKARLFSAFHRAGNARQLPGTGLGLAIVRQSVELHGGSVAFESTQGQGSTFTVKLPIATPGVGR